MGGQGGLTLETQPGGPKTHACPQFFLAAKWHKNAIKSDFSGFSGFFSNSPLPLSSPLYRARHKWRESIFSYFFSIFCSHVVSVGGKDVDGEDVV